MTIVTKEELKKMPNGIVFVEYKPEVLSGTIHILTGRYDDMHGWNGELTLEPIWDFKSNDKKRWTQWCVVDTSDIDYDDDQLFAV